MLSAALGLLAVIVLTAATGYFVAQEFAYVAADRASLEQAAARGDASARRAVKVIGRLSFMLSGAQLGITVTVRDLITVNWLPAWRGWDDACVFLFDLGVVDAGITESMTLQPTEIVGVEWCDRAAIERNATAATQELLAAVAVGGLSSYREAGAS